MTTEQVAAIVADLEATHPAMRIDIETMNPQHHTHWYQIWLWNEHVRPYTVCLQSWGEWERFKAYRALLLPALSQSGDVTQEEMEGETV